MKSEKAQSNWSTDLSLTTSCPRSKNKRFRRIHFTRFLWMTQIVSYLSSILMKIWQIWLQKSRSLYRFKMTTIHAKTFCNLNTAVSHPLPPRPWRFLRATICAGSKWLESSYSTLQCRVTRPTIKCSRLCQICRKMTLQRKLYWNKLPRWTPSSHSQGQLSPWLWCTRFSALSLTFPQSRASYFLFLSTVSVTIAFLKVRDLWDLLINFSAARTVLESLPWTSTGEF